ncbi:hypothetical protein [Hyunsoonleella pacifica]|uniref:Uncharacterized protein n=1 Tax=Hyunsoonleella pacifica TaxID=1080224 RepID=A0A4Q9FLK1_9FLAO|nr:hypothetical protein [Hyunsoonleella pacifica]TBN14550.1 hypothetical protein EYD46_13340 [Hyunsoonleella pacifica]GGD14724.1 hypothetical protein GCM10011368_15820 [Hyunsoonleella pacifica]
MLCNNCSEKNVERKTEMDAIILYGAELREERFISTFTRNGDSLNYKYVNRIDSSKVISIRKIKDSNFLFFGFEKFISINKRPFISKKLDNLKFGFYNLESPVVDGTGPILYNEDYGLLAVNNVYGPTIIFLKEEDDVLIEKIINKLND